MQQISFSGVSKATYATQVHIQNQSNRTGDADDDLVTHSVSNTWLIGVWLFPSISGKNRLQSAAFGNIRCSFGEPKGVPSESGGEYGDST